MTNRNLATVALWAILLGLQSYKLASEGVGLVGALTALVAIIGIALALTSNRRN